MTWTPSFTQTTIINQQLEISNVVIYPNPYNPKKDNLKIGIEMKGLSHVAKIRIYTSGYRMIKQITVPGNYVTGINTIEIERKYLTQLANGIYYIVVNMVDNKGDYITSKPQILVVLK
jgi:hypothetical protein